jgi:hypothetical protein
VGSGCGGREGEGEGWRSYQPLKKEGFTHIVSTTKSDDD